MSEKQPLYITTTLPYVNADPHIGFGAELVRADVVARAYQIRGHEVFLNTGTDEHGVKILEAANKRGLSPQEHVDELSERFRELGTMLGVIDDVHFIRTTDPRHEKAAQVFWQRVSDAGYIYKKNYEVKYCQGCELEKTDSELEDGRCPIHPDREIELISEENYFFAFSKFQDSLLEYYDKHDDFVVPEFRFREIKAFVKAGLQDFSISRVKEKMPWGVPVPGDESQVMYVWFDALVNYVSTLGWPDEGGDFATFWQKGMVVQYCGKDNLRQQAAMWQAMLLAAGLPLSNHIVIDGFLNVDGQKMSKSLGNVISPNELVKTYGTDAVRYFCVREFHPFEDTDISHAKLVEAYNANLANGVGNLAARIMKLAETYLDTCPDIPEQVISDVYLDLVDAFELQKLADFVWEKVGELDEYMTTHEPFKVIKTDPERAKGDIAYLARELYMVGHMLVPIMPDTAHLIKKAVRDNKKPDTLFPRIEL